MSKYLIIKPFSKKILFLGVSMQTKGGMTAVLVSYNKYIEHMLFIPTWRLGNKLVKSWYALQAVVRCYLTYVFNNNIKIVHIHGAANASFYRCRMFIYQAKHFHKKVILHEHAADFKEFYAKSTDKREIIEVINSCDKLIVLSQSWKTYFSSIGVEESKIAVLNNIVSHPIIKKQNRMDKKLHLLFLGEISKRKGVYDLLEAIAENKTFFETKLYLRMGGNVVDGDIKKFIIDKGIENFVSYEGWIAGKNKIDCLNWADVYILPSYNEGLPIAILEAMSYSHPVISTPVGGIPEVVHSGVNGILVEPGDISQIAQAIHHYINQPDAIRKEGDEAYHMIQAFFPEKVMKDLMKIYESVE